MSIFNELSNTTLGLVGSITNFLQQGRHSDIVSYTKSTRMEPVCLVESGLQDTEYLTDILQSLTTLYSAYYLQAIAISVNIGKIDTVRLLDALNPDRDPIASSISTTNRLATFYSQEDFKYGLPSNEARRTNDKGDDIEPSHGRAGKDTVKNFHEAPNLAVGKILSVELESEGHQGTIEVVLRLNTKLVTPSNLVTILAGSKKSKTAKGRYHEFKGAEIRFIQDILFASDIIDEHKRTAITDKSGIYRENMARNSKNKFAGLVSMNPTIAQASAISIITTETALDIERSIRGKLRNDGTREKFMDDSSTLILAVVDKDWNRVSIYTKSVAGSLDIRMKDMKSVGGTKGPDVGEILKAYQLGNQPSF